MLVWVQNDDGVCMSVGCGKILLLLAYPANVELKPILLVEVGQLGLEKRFPAERLTDHI